MPHWSKEQDKISGLGCQPGFRLGKPLAATEQVVGSIGKGSDLPPTTLDPQNGTLGSEICYGPVLLLSTDF